MWDTCCRKRAQCVSVLDAFLSAVTMALCNEATLILGWSWWNYDQPSEAGLKPLTVSKEPHLFQPDPVKGEHSTAIIASILQGDWRVERGAQGFWRDWIFLVGFKRIKIFDSIRFFVCQASRDSQGNRASPEPALPSLVTEARSWSSHCDSEWQNFLKSNYNQLKSDSSTLQLFISESSFVFSQHVAAPLACFFECSRWLEREGGL